MVCYLQADRSDCRGGSSASAGRGSKAEMVAERRKRVWDVEFSAVRPQTCAVVCLHLQDATEQNQFQTNIELMEASAH